MSPPATAIPVATRSNSREAHGRLCKKLHTDFKRRSANSRKEKVNWRARNDERKQKREAEFLKSLEDRTVASGCVEAANGSSGAKLTNQRTWYSLSVALPGSILNNAQSAELRTYVASQVARTCAIFCVDEVVIFDETARMKRRQRKAYKDGSWQGGQRLSEDNVECNFHMARILEYLECPQYLRRGLFPIQAPLKFAGVLNPLDCPHHFRSNELDVPYREGLVLDRLVGEGRGPVCDIGLNKELQLTLADKDDGEQLKPGTRVTVGMEPSEPDAKRLKGSLVNREGIRSEAGIYWGYKVRIARSLSDVLSRQYDMVVGTSERGTPISEMNVERREPCRILVVFGGLRGLEVAFAADESMQIKEPSEYFEHYINALPGQGSRTIRTEEAIPITFAALKCKLDAV